MTDEQLRNLEKSKLTLKQRRDVEKAELDARLAKLKARISTGTDEIKEPKPITEASDRAQETILQSIENSKKLPKIQENLQKLIETEKDKK